MKSKLTQGLGTWSGCLAPGDHVAPEEGQSGFNFFYSTSLTVLGDFNHIIVTLDHIFTLVDW